jgi:hypothetical protein
MNEAEAHTRGRRRPRPLPWIVPVAAAAATIVAVAIFLVERQRPAPANGSLVASESPPPPAAERERARQDGEKEGFAQEAPARKADGEVPADAGKLLALEEEKQVAQEAKLEGREGDRSGADELLARLAQGEPADALRRIVELPGEERVEERRERDLDSKAEKRRGESKDYEVADKRLGELAIPPALRFLRVKGDARRIDELLGKELRAWKAPQDYTGRSVVDLDANALKSLRERLTAAGLVCEELTGPEWLRAAQAAAANEGLAKRTYANKADDEERAKKAAPEKPKAQPEAPKLEGAAEATKGQGRTAGAAGGAVPAAPATAAPRRVERCFFLIER